jgi:hypothetical protein
MDTEVPLGFRAITVPNTPDEAKNMGFRGMTLLDFGGERPTTIPKENGQL